MTDQRPLAERLLDVALYAPVGIVVRLREDLPALVDTGRRQVSERVQLARAVGQLAVAYGRGRLAQHTAPAPAAPVPEPAPASAAVAHVDDGPPFEGYDTLPAAHVVQRLPRLGMAELHAVRAYEAGHRGRRTILAKVDQLVAG